MTPGPIVSDPSRVPPVLDRFGGPVVGATVGPGVTIVKPSKTGGPVVATISKTGVYRDNDGAFFVGKEGDALPDGWTYDHPLDGEKDVDPTVPTPEEAAKAKADAEAEQRAKGAAPQNKAQGAAPENRSA